MSIAARVHNLTSSGDSAQEIDCPPVVVTDVASRRPRPYGRRGWVDDSNDGSAGVQGRTFAAISENEASLDYFGVFETSITMPSQPWQ